MSDHTPGPWKYSFETIDPEWAVVTMKGGAVVANVNSNGQQEANARLISASPDLLEALEHILKSVEWQGGVTYKIKDGDLEKARAAIAKAKGS